MEDMNWYGYEDEETGEWISSLVVVYDPAFSKMPRQRWHRALDKINKVTFSNCFSQCTMNSGLPNVSLISTTYI